MSFVDDAFAGLKSRLEITATEQSIAQSRHKLIRDHVRASWDVSDDFLTGSYDRHTKTKKLKDVDIFVVIKADGAQGSLRQGTGKAAVNALAKVLQTKWPDVSTDDTVAKVSYAGEDVASYEIAPAFKTSAGYVIPNGSQWMATDPGVHATLVTAKNEECGGKFVPLIKMIKGINREAGEPIQPSFLLEVMALELVDAPLGRYQDEVRFFLASAADQILDDWADPAGLGNDVNAGSTSWDRGQQQAALKSWVATAEWAIDLENAGRERAAVDKWRELFGDRMPRP
jgi:hypothetical protein